MILLIRLFIIVILTLLQFAAPLIHAHTSASGAYVESAIHLPEFEQVDAPRHPAPLLKNTIAQSDSTVLMSIGIKNEQKIKQFLEAICLLGALFFALVAFVSSAIGCFFNQTEPIGVTVFLTLFAPRAPPALV